MKEKMPILKPAFAKNGTITAANSSKMNDAACSISNLKYKLKIFHQISLKMSIFYFWLMFKIIWLKIFFIKI